MSEPFLYEFPHHFRASRKSGGGFSLAYVARVWGEIDIEENTKAIAKKRAETDTERMSEGGKISVSIKSSQGEKLVVEVDPSGTVLEFKQVLQEKTNIPPEQQRLIFGGHVLKDARTVESYAIKDGFTVHLVRGASNNIAQQSAPQPTPAAPSATTNPFAGMGGLGGMGGMGGLGGLGGGGDLQQMYSQMMQNPQMVQQMMQNPMVQQMMNNPELLRTMMMSNPQIRQIVENNPEVGHILNDPDTLRQIMQAQSNPEIMRELQRTTDRAMSNIEAHPEGFNALRRLYTTIQEPLYEATQSQTQQAAASTNPFASLLGGGTTEQPTTTPNAAPLPNPWASGGAARPASAAPASGATGQQQQQQQNP